MITTSPLARVTLLPLCFKLCCSRKPLRYSDDHLPHSTSLHFFRYHALMIRSWFSNWWFCVSGNRFVRPNCNRFYVAQRAVILGTSTSWGTSCRSPQVSIPFPTVLLNGLDKTNHPLNWPPHRGALDRLNYHLTSFLVRKLCRRSSFITFLSHFVAATNVLPLSEYIFSGRPFLAIRRL